MAKILHFDFHKKELDKLNEFAQKKLPAPVKLHDRRRLSPLVTLKRKPEPPKAA